MNIQMQVSGLLVSLLLLYFYKRQETVGLYTEKFFCRALYVTIMCLVLDIVSVGFIVNQDRFPMWLIKFECKAYLVSLVCNGYVALVYTRSDIYSQSNANKSSRLFGISVLVFAVMIFILPVMLFYEGDIVYTYGPACVATYIGALFLIVVTLLRVIRQGNKMNPKRCRAIKIWMAVWIAAALIQFLNNQLLLVGFASAMGMVILFFELENPEANIDRMTGFFNGHAFTEFMKQKYREDLNACVLMISLEDAHTKDVLPNQIDAVIYEIARFMRRIPETKIFKTDEQNFILFFEDYEALDRAYRLIDERFQKCWLEYDETHPNVLLQPYYIIFPSKNMAESAEEMLGLLRYFQTRCLDTPENHLIVIDEGDVVKKRAREGMLGTLVAAMEEDRVEVFFQPIYSTHEKRFVSAEALVRIRKDDGGIIPPGLFIPVAEETGLISKLGEIIFKKTCQFIRETDIARYGIKYIEVNLSVVQCESKSLAKVYIDIMDQYSINPKLINLEITESASIIMKKMLLENMQVLMDYGVSFSLDDFGNGQSNLNYIVDMPVQIVKFDRDMTQAYFENEKAQFVLQAAMNMIHDMQLRVVSEGVETAAQLEALELLGIDYIQGYYFSKPVEGKAFIEFLKANNQ